MEQWDAISRARWYNFLIRLTKQSGQILDTIFLMTRCAQFEHRFSERRFKWRQYNLSADSSADDVDNFLDNNFSAYADFLDNSTRWLNLNKDLWSNVIQISWQFSVRYRNKAEWRLQWDLNNWFGLACFSYNIKLADASWHSLQWGSGYWSDCFQRTAECFPCEQVSKVWPEMGL